jgi:DNA-binding transcriptional MerR regulator
MRPFQSSDVSKLTGLSSHQLREWCTRRGIVPADVPGSGRGRHALFSWQTVLALRLLKELHERFGAEVGSWSDAMEQLREALRSRAFQSLWKTSVAFLDSKNAMLVEGRMPPHDAMLVVQLHPHLTALSEEFALKPEPQRTLFKALGVRR